MCVKHLIPRTLEYSSKGLFGHDNLAPLSTANAPVVSVYPKLLRFDSETKKIGEYDDKTKDRCFGLAEVTESCVKEDKLKFVIFSRFLFDSKLL